MRAGWTTKTLGELCEIRGGGTPSTQVSSYWQGDIPWVSPKDMKWEVITDSIDHVSTEAISRSATNMVAKDSILMVVRSGILARTVPLALAGRPLAINQDIKAFTPSVGISSRYIFLFLLSRMDTLLGLVSKGATVHRINTDHLKALHVPIPSYEEQESIVLILDQLFGEIEITSKNCERAISKAKQLSDSIFDELLRDETRKRGFTTLGEIGLNIFTGPFGTMLHKSDYVLNGTPLVNPLNMVNKGIISSSRMMIGEDTRLRLGSYALREQDVVVARRGEMGRCAVVTKNEDGWVCGTGSFFIRASTNVDSYFLAAYMRSNSAKAFLEKVSVGTTMSNLNHSVLNSLPFPNLTKEVQQRMIARLDTVASQIQDLLKQYEQKVEALSMLKKSILDKAYSGSL